MTTPARNLVLVRRSLSELITAIDEDLTVAHAVGDPIVTRPVITDPATRLPTEPGALVIGVGISPGDVAADELARQYAAAGAAALVLRTASADDHQLLADLGSRHGLTTIAARAAVDWFMLARQIEEAAAPRGAEELSGVRIGDIFSFANLVAARTGGATAIVDATGQLLGFSSLPDQPLDELRRSTTVYMREREAVADDPDYQRLYAEIGPIHLFGAPGEFDRVAVAIRDEGQVIGTIWVIVAPGHAWREVAEHLVTLVSEATAHLSRVHGHSSVERSREAALLDALLRGEDVDRAAHQLGVAASTWIRLAMIVPSTPETAQPRRLTREIASWIRIVHRGALITERPGRTVVLFHGSDPARWRAIDTALEQFLGTSASIRDRATIVTSAPVTDLGALPGEFDRVQILASLTATTGHRAALVRMDRDWAKVESAVIAKNYRGHDGGRMRVLDRIREHDRSAGSAFWPTLLALVETHGSIAAAASALHVHQNTIRQRIERIRELFGVDVTDPNHAIWLAIATRTVSA